MDKDFKMCCDYDCPDREDCFRWSGGPIQYGQAFIYGSRRANDEDRCTLFVVGKGRGKRSTFHRKVRAM